MAKLLGTVASQIPVFAFRSSTAGTFLLSSSPAIGTCMGSVGWQGDLYFAHPYRLEYNIPTHTIDERILVVKGRRRRRARTRNLLRVVDLSHSARGELRVTILTVPADRGGNCVHVGSELVPSLAAPMHDWTT